MQTHDFRLTFARFSFPLHHQGILRSGFFPADEHARRLATAIHQIESSGIHPLPVEFQTGYSLQMAHIEPPVR